MNRMTFCENGFSFEYSATFGQAMKGKGGLEAIYARNILFDYSYKYFYRDGFGKDYRILNLADDSDEERRNLYLTACLVAFYQQQKLYADSPATFRPFLLQKPLWVFVGSSVNAVRSENRRKVSDVVDILLTLAARARTVTGGLTSTARLSSFSAVPDSQLCFCCGTLWEEPFAAIFISRLSTLKEQSYTPRMIDIRVSGMHTDTIRKNSHPRRTLRVNRPRRS